MNERALELFARHLALPQIGVAGQERLLAQAVRVDPDFPDVARALERMGLRLEREAACAVMPDETLPQGQVLFDLDVMVGPQAFSMAAHPDAAAPLHMKQRFF